ncbi:Flotillin-like protein 1 [Goodea atripinnis]|uniref:Flotillin n=1 Tax=Goodea atripinnis TaxID=208336 RepID=A0ABV0N891_9TELE
MQHGRSECPSLSPLDLNGASSVNTPVELVWKPRLTPLPPLINGACGDTISLNTLTLNVKSDKVYTRHGVPISVTGIAQMKIQGQNKQMLAAACQMFMGKSEGQIAQIALETLEGHQRAIIAHLTDYLHSLGKARTAQVQKDARIGEAQNKRDAVMREAHALQEKISAQYKNEIDMAKAQRDYELKKAAYDIEVNTKKAESEMAYQLQVAKTKQRIEDEKMQIQVVERSQQIMLQEQEITRKEKELEAKVKKPAEAERYRLEKLAEAQRISELASLTICLLCICSMKMIMEAEAEAESIRVKGEAEAFAVEAKGRAEAEQMAKKAEAFREYKDGAMVDMLLEKLPLMAEEISRPLCEANKVTMVSSGGGDIGAAKLSGEVLNIMTRLPEAVEKLTGINISQVTHSPGSFFFCVLL